jgi:hypothetical protein
MYADRYNQIDARITKNISLPGRMRLRAMVDSYNLFNTATPLSHSNTFGGLWLRPLTLPPGRFAKFGLQLDF